MPAKTTTTAAGRDTTAEIAYLTRALKAPTLRDAVARLGERARAEWVARLATAHHAGRLQDEITKLGRIPLLIIDEVGYIPFEPEAANLFFQLISARYERSSVIITSNKPFGRWGEVFGDDVVAAAMIDRLVHHAEVISLKGDSYRLKNRYLGRVPAATTDDN